MTNSGPKASRKTSKQSSFTFSMFDLFEALMDSLPSLPSPTQELAQLLHANIHEAAQYGSHAGILAYKADINKIDENGDTPLHIAVTHRRDATVAFLIENGANPELSNKLGQTAFHLATVLKNPKMMALLHSLNANIESPNILKQTPLHTAVYGGNINIVKQLLEYDAEIDVPNQIESPIAIAEKLKLHEIANELQLYKTYKIDKAASANPTMAPQYTLARRNPRIEPPKLGIAYQVEDAFKRALSRF